MPTGFFPATPKTRFFANRVSFLSLAVFCQPGFFSSKPGFLPTGFPLAFFPGLSLPSKPGFLPTGFLFFPRNPVFCQPGFWDAEKPGFRKPALDLYDPTGKIPVLRRYYQRALSRPQKRLVISSMQKTALVAANLQLDRPPIANRRLYLWMRNRLIYPVLKQIHKPIPRRTTQINAPRTLNKIEILRFHRRIINRLQNKTIHHRRTKLLHQIESQKRLSPAILRIMKAGDRFGGG